MSTLVQFMCGQRTATSALKASSHYTWTRYLLDLMNYKPQSTYRPVLVDILFIFCLFSMILVVLSVRMQNILDREHNSDTHA